MRRATSGRPLGMQPDVFARGPNCSAALRRSLHRHAVALHQVVRIEPQGYSIRSGADTFLDARWHNR